MKRKWIIMLTAGSLCLSVLNGCGQEKETEVPVVLEQPSEGTEDVKESDAQETDGQKETDSQETAEEIQEEKEAQDSAENVLPFSQSMEFYFSSGAGAWGTQLTLNADGTFSGEYGDTDMESGDGYQGIHYFSVFSGQFGNIKKLNDYSYSMTLEELNQEKTEEYIEDEILYKPAEPYGLTDGVNFVLYTPDAPLDELDEMFKSWHYMEEGQEKLSCYGIWNRETGDGFFTYD